MRRLALLTRSATLVGAACGAVAMLAVPAAAASGPLDYDCAYVVGDVEGSGTATAAWDSGVPDGLVVQVGDEVSLDPYTGTIELPGEFVDELRTQQVDELAVSGLQVTVVDETGETYVLELQVPRTPVPAEGPVSVDVTGGGSDPIEATEPGTYTLVAVAFLLGDDEETTGLFCDLAEQDADLTVDSFEVQAPPTSTPTVTVTAQPTPTVTVSASPVRPVRVDTDSATPSGASAASVTAGLGVLALLGSAASRLRPARRRTRAH